MPPPTPPRRPPPQLVGRARELSYLENALDDAFLPHGPGAVELVGEAGIGKSALLDRLAASAAQRGAMVLRGRCSEFERDLPYALFDAALETALAVPPPGLARHDLAQLAVVFPAAQGHAAPAAVPERFRLHRAVRALLAELAAPRGLVLLLDDLHWADPGSVALVGSLVRRPASGRMLLALAHRPRQAGTAVGPEVRRAAAAGLSVRIALRPLDDEEADAMLPAELPRPARERIREEAGGNPFCLEQLARAAAVAPGVGSPPAMPDQGVPELVRDALLSETAPLPPAAMRLLEGAAIAGDPFEVGFAAEVAGVEGGGAGALETLLAADLVRATERPRWFRFRHPLVRRTVYEGTGAARRLAGHGRAAALLGAAGADVTSRARHVERSAAAGDPEAVGLLAAAAREVMARAPGTAARWLAVARDLQGGGRGGAPAPDLLGDLAGALAAAGRFADARAALLEGLERLEADDAGRVGAIVAVAAMERLLGDHDGARARLAAALAAQPGASSAGASALRLELVAHASLASDFPTMRAQAVIARADAIALGDRVLEAAATAALTMAEYSVGDVPAARARGAEATALVGGLQDGELGGRLELLLYLGWATYFLGDVQAALTHFGRGSAVARRAGSTVLAVELMVGQALGLCAQGRIAEALDVADAAVEEARPIGSVQTLVWSLFAQTTVLEAGGDPAAAVRSGEEAFGLAADLAPSSIVAGCGAALGAALVAVGDGARAATVLLELQGGPELPRFFPGQRAACYETLAAAALLEGDVGVAAGWVGRAGAAAVEAGLPLAVAIAARAEARLRLAEGDAGRAATLARSAAAAADRLGLPVEAARGRILAGRALAALGERDAAARELRAAEAALPGGHLRAEAVRELRRIGRRVNRQGRGGRADAFGRAALSARELEIARLVAAGGTNREVAEALFLSPKTVESHLSSAFVKLGVSSRQGLVAAL